jgi:hypothetical protein
MRAVFLNQLTTAVEAYEEGKTVFWMQALRLRSNALDDLPAAERNKLRQLFEVLDQDDGVFTETPDNRAVVEKHIEHRRQLSIQADCLIEEIRLRPRFDRFLKVSLFKMLA